MTRLVVTENYIKQHLDGHFWTVDEKGMVRDIGETVTREARRLAELKKKARENGLRLSGLICKAKAFSNIQTEINRLEIEPHSLNANLISAAIYEGPRDWLFISSTMEPISRSDVIRTVARYSGFTMDEIKGVHRFKPLVKSRHVAAYCLCKIAGLSYPRAGVALGHRDHTTILHAVKKVSDNRDAYEPLLSACLSDLIVVKPDEVGEPSTELEVAA